jgi:hypothetical protein
MIKNVSNLYIYIYDDNDKMIYFMLIMIVLMYIDY